MQYSKEYTVRYNTSLSPTRGGGSSPSGSIPHPSPLITRARTCYRTGFQLRRGLSTSLSTIRDCPSHRTGSFLLVHTSAMYRTVCSFSGFLMMYLPTSRPYYNMKSFWPARTWHWSHLAFGSEFPALALYPPVHTHTVRDFIPIFNNRTVLLFLFFAYRTGFKNLKNKNSQQRTNLIHSRKKFY